MSKIERMELLLETFMSRDSSGSNEERRTQEIPVNNDATTQETLASEETNRFRRLELPIFSRDDTMGWVFRVERYFRINGISEIENWLPSLFA